MCCHQLYISLCLRPVYYYITILFFSFLYDTIYYYVLRTYSPPFFFRKKPPARVNKCRLISQGILWQPWKFACLSTQDRSKVGLTVPLGCCDIYFRPRTNGLSPGYTLQAYDGGTYS
jgi:hypothetical protein